MKSVSVIIPTWNRANTIRRAVESALNQSCQVKEVLVCDDGSTDNSKEIISGLTDKDNRVKWIDCGRNGMPAKPRNIGVRLAAGDWVAFLDSDDWWEETKIERQLNYLQSKDAFFCCTNAYRHTKTDGALDFFAYGTVVPRISLKELVEVNTVICSSVLVKKELVRKVGGFPEGKEFKAIEDFALWLRIACFSDILFLDKNLINYTDCDNDSIRSDSLPFQLQQKIIFKDLYSWACSSFLSNPISEKDSRIIKFKYNQYNPSLILRIKRRLKAI